ALHLVAGTDPAPELRLFLGIGIEVARAERPADLLDVLGETHHDRLRDGPVGVQRRPRFLGVLAGVGPHLVDVRLRGFGHECVSLSRSGGAIAGPDRRGYAPSSSPARHPPPRWR